MKIYNKPLIGTVLILITIAFLQSCDKSSPIGIYKNEKIDDAAKSRFHELNNKLFAALKTNDEPQLEYIMSEDFMAVTNKKRVVELASNRFKEDEYQLMDEYYVVSRYIHGDTIKSTLKDGGKYTVYCPAGVKEIYIAFFVPKRIPNQYMITAVYAKLDYGWKLTQLDVGRYAINGRSAPESLKAAKEAYAKGFLVDAVNIAGAAVECSRPNLVLKYDDEADMTTFYNTALTTMSARYNVPVPIKGAPVHLEIIRITTQTTPEGEFPMIYYLTNIKLKDTTAIKKENEVIQKVINKTIPGLDQDKKYVFYSAFNEWPTGEKTVEHFDMTQKLK
jgi:hypothetical protein